MKWRGREGSRNIEDRRATSSVARGGGIGIVGLILILVFGYFFGVDISPLVQDTGGQIVQGPARELTEEEKEAGEFVSVVLADTEQVWDEVFRTQLNSQYTPPTLVLFSEGTQSPCGGASAATGPFYCPVDRKAYLDTAFFATMHRQLGAGGDFAQAYVVAHEIGHHVQNLLGTLGEANRARQRMTQTDSNAVSVMIELQADCYSGIWARYSDERLGTLDEGDIAEAMNAAKQIGDDTLQRNAGQRPMPHTFTHGTSEQRQRWFAIGYQTGRMDKCDTFSARQL